MHMVVQNIDWRVRIRSISLQKLPVGAEDGSAVGIDEGVVVGDTLGAPTCSTVRSCNICYNILDRVE